MARRVAGGLAYVAFLGTATLVSNHAIAQTSTGYEHRTFTAAAGGSPPASGSYEGLSASYAGYLTQGQNAPAGGLTSAGYATEIGYIPTMGRAPLGRPEVTEVLFGTTPFLTGTAPAGSQVRFFFDDQVFRRNGEDVVAGTPGGTFALNLPAPLDPGIHRIEAQAFVPGLESERSEPVDVRFEVVRGVFQARVTGVNGQESNVATGLKGATRYTFEVVTDARRDGANETVATRVRVHVKVNGDYRLSDGAPKVSLKGLGIDVSDTYNDQEKNASGWDLVDLAGIPGAAGVLELTVETFSTAEGAEAYVDDIQVTEP